VRNCLSDDVFTKDEKREEGRQGGVLRNLRRKICRQRTERGKGSTPG